jgi:CheY-like chemotaxis protein
MAKILIIEDDEYMARLYRKLFVSADYQVEVAAGGEEGLKQVEVYKPDLIILDIMMPKIHGLEVLERLKANPETKGIPVVVLTNLAGRANANEALGKGAEKYLVKSDYEPEEVVKIVGEVLASHFQKTIPPQA